ncbi:MAG: hypothetical protein IT381_04220 [Deltaproteobacteria bacterium]|nr:hypothetical protein [Deltaproteobacteria bacterium]
MTAALLLTALLSATPAVSPTDVRPTVAIMYFDYDGPDASLAVLKKGFAQILITDLSAIETLRFVERARLQDVLDEQKLGLSAKMDKSTVVRIGKLLGARYIVTGGYFDLSGALRVDARTIDVETGEIRGVGATGTAGEFMELEEKLAAGLAKVLVAQADPKAVVPTAITTNRNARGLAKKAKIKSIVSYSKALDAKDRKDTETAKKELQVAVAAEPELGLAANELKALMR